ncbi:MAG: SDR family oxidoreductase, partial [Acidimicrobiaceae bacterium]|nr:SDR family oxidoreductase [Acidimicrobiaceae bacterium]
MQVTDRVCVVTGGGSGIGKALCERFAADGARKVIVVDRAADNATAVADAIGGDAEVVDVGDEAEITEMLLRVEDTYGPIDVLCNNAGIASGGNPLDTPVDEWQRQWDINVMSHVY